MSRLGIFFLLLLSFAAAQTGNQDVFTINIASPTAPQDVQVRYRLSGDPAVQQGGSIARPGDGSILVSTAVEGRAARGLRAIIFSPGCQFVTVSADDLAASPRQADFQCQKLATTPLHGKVDVARFSGRQLQVETLYVCGWAGQFFGVPGLAISPLSVATAKVEKDGAFAVDLPDFSGDPSWANLSRNATLMFVLVDAATGRHLARLSAPRDVSRGGSLKVAQSYPADITFAVRSLARP